VRVRETEDALEQQHVAFSALEDAHDRVVAERDGLKVQLGRERDLSQKKELQESERYREIHAMHEARAAQAAMEYEQEAMRRKQEERKRRILTAVVASADQRRTKEESVRVGAAWAVWKYRRVYVRALRRNRGMMQVADLGWACFLVGIGGVGALVAVVGVAMALNSAEGAV